MPKDVPVCVGVFPRHLNLMSENCPPFMVSSFSVRNAPVKPGFVYDSECGFCSRWVALWKDLTEGRVDFIPAKESAFQEIPASEYGRSSQFIDTDGRVYSGAEAVFRMLAYAHGNCWWLRAYRCLRGFEPASEFVYSKFAANRYFISRINRLFIAPELPRLTATRDLFLRLLGLVYLCAFASLLPQARGLFGEEGILPVAELMQSAGQQLSGSVRWQALPTLFWFSTSDGFLLFQCGAGALLSIILMIGFLPAVCTALLWILWLSLTVAGRDFMSFQWEALLLESGFLAIFLAPMSRVLWRGERPAAVAIFLFRWLLFRLMLMSGMVKLLSGDPSWRYFTALFYHFETQPLPTVLGWHSYQLHSWVLVAQTGLMYLIEIGFAFLVFGRRKVRLVAFFGFVALQLGIALTGNYGYFNLLAAVLCVPLLDDRFLRAGERKPLPLRVSRNTLLTGRSIVLLCAALVILLVSSMQLITGLHLKSQWSEGMMKLYATVAPFRSINTYGLFAVMTKTRPEIVVQGSADGEIWKDYEFKYKPRALNELPGWVAPHQPRLDWQMWFAALGSYEQNRWFVRFCGRLLEGSPPVLDLLAVNPFPAKPPKFIRALVYDYEFTTAAERRESGNYWVRKGPREYLPPVSLEQP